MEVTKPKRPRGRPPGTGKPIKDESEKVKKTSVTIRADQIEKFKALGGSEWLQQMIDKAN
jgi:uncharacterized protein (DUF4415 family)